MAKDSGNETRWKHKFGFHNRGVQWDTPMSKWAGERKDWIQLKAQGPPCKEDVAISFPEDDESANGEKDREMEEAHRRRNRERPGALGT